MASFFFTLIMSNTKISGVKANIAKWNEKLAIDLEEAIATLQTNMNTIHLGNNHNSTSENKNYDEKCGKCNRNCSIRRSSANVNLCALLYSSDLFAIARVVFFLSLIEVQVVQV
jgi:hypothetical protein